MSSYFPPDNFLPIFNPEEYIQEITPITLAQADARYLRLTGGILSGLCVFSSGLQTTFSNYINSGFTSSISAGLLTGNRVLTIPDAGGEIVVAGATQDISSKLYQARNGTVSAPSYTFDLFPNTGMWNDGANSRLHFSVNGNELLRLNQNEIITYQAIEVPDGTVSVPSYAFASNRDCGFYYENKSSFVSCAFDGVRKIAIGPNSTIHGNVNFLPFGSGSAPSLAFGSLGVASITGLFYRNSSVLGFAAGGSEIANINTGGLEMTAGKIIEADDGNEATPSITFTGENTTGIYRTSADELSFSVGGTRRGFFSTSQLRMTVPIRTNDGTAGSPAFSFANDTDCGMYRIGTNEIAFSANSTQRMRISGTAINIPYSAGGTSLAFDREDGGISAGRMFMDTAALGNNLNISATSGGANIILAPSASGLVSTTRYFESDLAYTGLTGTFRACSIRSDGIISYDSSSARYKSDIKSYEKGLDDLIKIEPKTFRYSKDKIVERKLNSRTGKEKKTIAVIDKEDKEEAAKIHVGLIAEDIFETGLTEFVDYDEDGNPDGVRYKELIVLCINAIKELAKK